MIMWGIEKYQDIIQDILIKELNIQLDNVKPGHCMKLTGLPEKALLEACLKIRNLYANIDCWLLAAEPRSDYEITATKLVELRNKQEKPLLVLIPSNLRTAAEDSFGDATFQEIKLEGLEAKAINELERGIPQTELSIYKRIISFLTMSEGKIQDSLIIRYLIYIKENNYSKESFGRCLYLFGLIPDDLIAVKSELVEQRLRFNIDSVNILKDAKIPLLQRINQLNIESNTLQPELYRFLCKKESPELVSIWGEEIASNASYYSLNMSQWKFKTLREATQFEVRIQPLAGSNLTFDDNGDQRIVTKQGSTAKVQVKFETLPSPSECPYLEYFTISLMRTGEDGVIEYVKRLVKFKKTPGKTSERKKQVILDSSEIDEGVYFLRVQAYDKDDNLLNVNNPFRDKDLQDEWQKRLVEQGATAERSDLIGKLTCDSEDFYFRIEGADSDTDSGEDRDHGSKSKVYNLMQAFVSVRQDYISSKQYSNIEAIEVENGFWTDNNSRGNKKEAIFEVHFNDWKYQFIIPVANKLRLLQFLILKNPAKLGVYCIDFTKSNNHMAVEPYLKDSKLDLNAPEGFIEARSSLYNRILNSYHDDSGNGIGVFETADLRTIKNEIEVYLDAYKSWIGDVLNQIKARKLDRNVFELLRQIQLLDMIELIIVKPDGGKEKVYLMSPLHPLRLAWYSNLYTLYFKWEKESTYSGEPNKLWNEDIRRLFLGTLQPSLHPLLINSGDMKNFYYSGEVAPGWGLYVPVNSHGGQLPSFKRILQGIVQDLLGVPERLRYEADYSHISIYKQIERYLIQHPYVDTLVVNIFNPGDGEKFIECLKLLQKQNVYQNLNYEIRMFAVGAHEDSIGKAFDDFMNPAGLISDEADAFIIPSPNSLFPKLRFSRNNITEYLNDPEKFMAHLTFIIDFFPVDVKVVKTGKDEQSIFSHGLIVDPIIERSSLEEDFVGWNRYICTNDVLSIDDNDIITNNAVISIRQLQQLISTTLIGRLTEDVPALSLQLNDSQRTLLYHIHQNSDWVATIDRNLGIEFFDAPSVDNKLSYLLDFKPGNDLGEAPLYLTTKPSSEITGIVYPHMLSVGLVQEKEFDVVNAFLESIRSISGSVLMNLTSGHARAFEVLGIGLTKLLLSKTGLLNNSFIIPIDIHKELFERMSSNNEDSSAKRADLLVVNCDTVNREIHFHVIEVKCRTNAGNEWQVNELKTRMAEQMDNTIKCLQYHFDASYKIPDRLDRVFKIKEFRKLLEFYIQRAHRYGYIEDVKYDQFMSFLKELEYRGYTLSFEKAGIIFDLTLEDDQIKPERDSTDQVFFHISLGVMKQLLVSLRKEEKDEDKVVPNTVYDSFIEPFTNYTARKNTFLGLKPKKVMEEQLPIESKEELKIPENVNAASKEKETEANIDKPDNTNKQNTSIVAPEYEDFLGETAGTPQYGILGIAGTRRVAFDLNGCNTISIFGVPGGGKSYTVGTIVEMATKYIPNICKLEKPLASVIFHYHESQDYPPEFVSMVSPNTKETEIKKLKEVYGAEPASLDDVILLAPVDKVKQRRKEYPNIEVLPISFAPSELDIKAWKFLMGAMDNQAMYIQQMNMIMRRLRDNLTLSALRDEIEDSRLSDSQKEYAFNRLEIAEQFIDDTVSLRSLLKPGRMIIVDLRDEFIEKEQALGLFVVMLNIFAGAETDEGEKFNKLIVFDEAHKYMAHSELTKHVVETIRQMRHQGVTLLIASQDPPSLPNEIIELSSAVILHRFNSPQWLKHVQKSLIALNELTPTQMAALQPGEAYLWANKASNPQWTHKAIKISTRPRVTLHGGGTQKAVE